MNSDLVDMVNEVKEKIILHWNYRGLKEIPEAIKDVDNNIQEIYLKWNNLRNLPHWICNFSNVTNLYLYGNNIEKIPESLGYMFKLTVLDLSANQLKELPFCLGYLKNLVSLSVSQNFLTSLPVSMSQLKNLESLCLSGNQLIALPSWLGSLPNLKELFADNNHLKEIPNRLTLSKSLSIISVCCNKLKYLPMNGFVSAPCIHFDSNPLLNYLSVPVLYQLKSKIPYPLSQESGNAYGCFRPNKDEPDNYVNIKLVLVPKSNLDRHKEISIELPRELFFVHNLQENKVISLTELSLRKIYLSRFHHTLDVFLDPPKVEVKQTSILDKTLLNENEISKFCILYNLISNGPISVCINRFCIEPIFTEAWIIFGIERNNFVIPTIAIFCSHRCATEFIETSNFIKSHEMYVILK